LTLIFLAKAMNKNRMISLMITFLGNYCSQG